MLSPLLKTPRHVHFNLPIRWFVDLFLDEIPVKRRKKPWSTSEMKAVTTHFHKHIIGSTLPGKTEIVKFLKTSNITGRSWNNVKDFVRNYKLRTKRTSMFGWTIKFTSRLWSDLMEEGFEIIGYCHSVQWGRISLFKIISHLTGIPSLLKKLLTPTFFGYFFSGYTSHFGPRGECHYDCWRDESRSGLLGFWKIWKY